MPEIRDYPEATDLRSTDAFVIDRVGVGTMYIEARNFALVYDIAMGYPALIPASAPILVYVAVRTVGLPATNAAVFKATLQTAPIGNALVLPITANGVGVGSLTFTQGNTVGSFTWPGDVNLLAGQNLVISSPGSTFGAANLAVTFAGVIGGV